MKNIFIKILACLIIFFTVCLPVIGAMKNISKPNLMEESTTLILEEFDTFSEAGQENIIIIDFEDKLKMIQTKGKNPIIFVTTSSKNEIAEITTIIEKQKLTEEKTSTTTTKITEVEPDIVLTTTEIQEETAPKVEALDEDENLNNVSNSEHTNAAIIWNYLRELGYNKAVCAGILGNIMAEVGGQTLTINPYLYSGNYYGICQWSLEYAPSINGSDIYTQLNYLANTIRSEFNTFGYKYYNGFNYNAFLEITDPGAAAKAFAICYERCANWTYSVRIGNAYIAYGYFA